MTSTTKVLHNLLRYVPAKLLQYSDWDNSPETFSPAFKYIQPLYGMRPVHVPLWAYSRVLSKLAAIRRESSSPEQFRELLPDALVIEGPRWEDLQEVKLDGSLQNILNEFYACIKKPKIVCDGDNRFIFFAGSIFNYLGKPLLEIEKMICPYFSASAQQGIKRWIYIHPEVFSKKTKIHEFIKQRVLKNTEVLCNEIVIGYEHAENYCPLYPLALTDKGTLMHSATHYEKNMQRVRKKLDDTVDMLCASL